MARRRGFFAEMQHQAKLAEQRQRAIAREQAAAMRRVEQARVAQRRAQAAFIRASEADRKRLEKEAMEAHVAMKLADVDKFNVDLAEVNGAIDSLLEATLSVDDFVDLETLRQSVVHPPFDREELRAPIPMPVLPPDTQPPMMPAPASPSGLFGRKKRAEEGQAHAQASYAREYSRWENEIRHLAMMRRQLMDQHAAAELKRMNDLEREWARYQNECAGRDQLVAERNAELDSFMTNLSYGDVEAVKDYVEIVLANSVYPESFSVEHHAEFNPSSAELDLQVIIPGPDAISTVKAYRYMKTNDEITSSALAQKVVKDRYARATHQIALRSLHEVFESDRRGLIQSISVEVGTRVVDPATGRDTYIPFIAVSADREKFSDIELAAVVPVATLEYLGASVSKNPLGLVAISTGGVRRSS